MPYNLTFGGMSFVGTVLFVGVAGDEFADLSERKINFLMQCLEVK